MIVMSTKEYVFVGVNDKDGTMTKIGSFWGEDDMGGVMSDWLRCQACT